MPYIHTEEDRQREIDMLSNPERWPLSPMIFVKRWHTEHKINLGRVFANQNGVVEPVVVPTNTNFDSRPRPAPMVYQSIEAMVDDGWVVD